MIMSFPGRVGRRSSTCGRPPVKNSLDAQQGKVKPWQDIVPYGAIVYYLSRVLQFWKRFAKILQPVRLSSDAPRIHTTTVVAVEAVCGTYYVQ